MIFLCVGQAQALPRSPRRFANKDEEEVENKKVSYGKGNGNVYRPLHRSGVTAFEEAPVEKENGDFGKTRADHEEAFAEPRNLFR
jgi:hypothetical protein